MCSSSDKEIYLIIMSGVFLRPSHIEKISSCRPNSLGYSVFIKKPKIGRELIRNPCGKTPVFRRDMKAWLYILLVFDVFHDGLLRHRSCTPYIIRARPQCGQTAPQPIMALSKHMGRIPLHLVDDQLRGDCRGCQIQSNVI